MSQLENVAHEVRMVAAANLPADATEAQRIAEIRRLLADRQRADRALREAPRDALDTRIAEWSGGDTDCVCGASSGDRSATECEVCEMFRCSSCDYWTDASCEAYPDSTKCEDCWWAEAFG